MTIIQTYHPTTNILPSLILPNEHWQVLIALRSTNTIIEEIIVTNSPGEALVQVSTRHNLTDFKTVKYIKVSNTRKPSQVYYSKPAINKDVI